MKDLGRKQVRFGIRYTVLFAKRYLNFSADSMGGYEDSLASACEALRSAAASAASTFGYGGGLSWDLTPLAKTNEIYVDFR